MNYLESILYGQLALKTREISAPKRTGLENLGNSCYLNSSLQALFCCEQFRVQVIMKSNENRGLIMHNLLADLFSQMSTTDELAIRPTEFRQTFMEKHRSFSGNTQQDAQEFVTFLLQDLHSEVNAVNQPQCDDNCNYAAHSMTVERAWKEYTTHEENSYLVDMFCGLNNFRTTCENGHNWPVFSPFWCAILDIPTDRYISQLDIQKCFDWSISTESLVGVYCAQCNRHVSVKRRLTFDKLPNILIVSLKVFDPFEGKLRPKIRVNEVITVNNQQFALQSCVFHIGKSIISGHYYAYGKINDIWYWFNDSIVTPESVEMLPFDVITDVYLLFYEKSSVMSRHRDLSNIDWEYIFAKRITIEEPHNLSFELLVKHYEQKFTSWDQISNTNSNRILCDDDLKYFKSKGILFRKKLCSGKYGDMWEVLISGLSIERVPLEWSVACKIQTINSFRCDQMPIKQSINDYLRETTFLDKLDKEDFEGSKFLCYKSKESEEIKEVPHLLTALKIVRLYDDQSGFPHPIRMYLFMDLFDTNFDDFLQSLGERGFNENHSLIWFIQIADAIRYLHARKFSHSDIKPSNILMKFADRKRSQFTVKLTGFSLTRDMREEKTTETILNRYCGHHHYIAPEIMRRMCAHNAYKADIFSLGVTLADSLAGRESANSRNTITDRNQLRMHRLINNLHSRTTTRPRITCALSNQMRDLLRLMTFDEPNQRIDINSVLKFSIVFAVRSHVDKLIVTPVRDKYEKRVFSFSDFAKYFAVY